MMNSGTTLPVRAPGADLGDLLDVDAVSALILAGERLLLAGDEALLARLPRGTWIGGTIPYFVAADGGTSSRERLFCTRLPAEVEVDSIRLYDAASLAHVCADAPAEGFSVMILPAFSEVHSLFARNAPNYEDMYLKPLIGWIAGVHLDDLGRATPKVFDGSRGEGCEERAVVLHARLPEPRYARIEIVNLFRPGSGPGLRFTDKGFSAVKVLVDGVEQDFAAWLRRQGTDTRLPLVADYCGAMVNVSIKSVEAGRVDFYAPVFPDIEYRIAAPIDDYVARFLAALPADVPPVTFSCNCILNYLYSNLEGRHTGPMRGPATFGEIAYQLLNQTLVYLTIEG